MRSSYVHLKFQFCHLRSSQSYQGVAFLQIQPIVLLSGTNYSIDNGGGEGKHFFLYTLVLNYAVL